MQVEQYGNFWSQRPPLLNNCGHDVSALPWISRMKTTGLLGDFIPRRQTLRVMRRALQLIEPAVLQMHDYGECANCWHVLA